jgi:transposase-like protein
MLNAMAENFPTYSKLWELFFDKHAAEEYPFQRRVLDLKPQCYVCMGPTKWKGKLWICLKKLCTKAVSIAKGSFFEQCKLKFSEVLHICYLWLAKVPSKSIMLMTGHSSATVLAFIKYFGQVCGENIKEEEYVIGGPDVEVEIDECKISKQKYNRGRHIEGAWIFGGIEHTTEKRIFVEVVENRTAETLTEVMAHQIHPASIILSDFWRRYSGLTTLGFSHSTVTHSRHFKDPETQVHTNGIEAPWSGIKQAILVHNQSSDTIHEKLLSYIWMRQNKKNRWEGFMDALANTHFS